MIYGNSLSFNASSLSCLIINSEKRVWKTDNPTHCASADHNHINFGIRLPFTFALDSMQVLGARGLCHPLHNRVGTEQWHPILPSRGAQYHRERETLEVLFICLARYWASFFIFTRLIIIWPNLKSSAFFKSRREILDGHFVTVVKQG